jgi:hypothetical protein
VVLDTTPSAISTNNAQTGELLNEFFLLRGHCFRIFKSEMFRTAYCDEPVAWKGQWRDVKGEVWTVEACARHRPG